MPANKSASRYRPRQGGAQRKRPELSGELARFQDYECSIAMEATMSHKAVHRETSERKVREWGGRFGFAWVTLAFFLFSLAGHWLFGWFSFVSEQTQHAQPIEVSAYVAQMMRDTLENWQSEFLQLLWQVAGLAILLHIGSPQSKEGDERQEAKLDEILRRLDPKHADDVIRKLDVKFHRT
jgi:hypothetical protein